MKFSILKSKTIRMLALLLAVLTVAQLWVEFALPTLSAGVGKVSPYITLDNERVSNVTLYKDAKLRFDAVAETSADAYQWQIKDPGSDRWINIHNCFAQNIWVTQALIGSMLDSEGEARMRCKMRLEGEEVFTDEVKVSALDELQPPVETESQGNAVVFKSARPAPTSDPEYVAHSIVINYLFDNNAIAFEPYGATIAHGSDFEAVIESPKVVGYAPFRRVGDDYVAADKVEINLTNVQEDLTINIIYRPALVNFSVHHHLQNVDNDDYSLHYDRITTSQALTGSIVGDGLALSEEELPGFQPLAYEKLPVAADGSTVIEIRYDRNYYLVDFDMNGGYGSEPVYTRYGAAVGANTPTRRGYVFDGWELVSYGGAVPTEEQKSKYLLTPGNTILVPEANLQYRARWITQQTTYTMVFWRENANDSGYSYWGYLDNLSALSGSLVDGQDYISRVTGIDDEQYFTFNSSKTDKNVLVEGDGSTVVNVYYTRNYYSITFKAPGKCTITPNHTHAGDCYENICGVEHIHSEECLPQLSCQIPQHLAHTPECLTCGKEAHIHGQLNCNCNIQEHTHVKGCWNNVGNAQSYLWNAPTGVEDGYIYRSGQYYIYIKGTWYRYSGRGVSNGDVVDPACGYSQEHTHGTNCQCDKENHTHSDSCYRDVIHDHTDSCYSYSCGAQEHTHTDECMRVVCGIPEKHTHTSTCTRESSTNVVKTVYAKYQQSLEECWPVTDDNGVVYDDGQRWKPSNSKIYTEVLVYMSKMIPENFTLTVDVADRDLYTMNYYLEVLPGYTGPVKEYDGRKYALYNTITARYSYLTKAEDFFEIEGFNTYKSDPAFGSNGQLSSSKNVNMYYNRITDHELSFKNEDTVLEDMSVYGIMYEAPLSSYNFEPPYPDIEPNAYSFAGWYTSPGCFPGTEVNWDTLTMPVGDLMLYAKWEPVKHTIRVFKDNTLSEQIGTDQTVDHNAFANPPEGNISNGNYIFQGWFYMDEVNGVQVEKAFAFNGIPVVDDMDIYAKWSSHVSVDYQIYYKLLNTGEDIADPTIGSAIAGHNKTFDAKAGDELNEGYKSGYYPLTNSHTLTMSVDGSHEFTFYYVYVEAMPYKVQYINAETGEKLCDDKLVMDNTLSVVTETFKRFDKMMPDAYQKRLVLSADDSSIDENGIYNSNVITFYYRSDDKNAYYRVVHYIENIQGDTYREYRAEDLVGVIGNSYSADAIDITGFTFNSSKTTVNGVVTPVTGNKVTATLGPEGMLIELYYDRNEYDYQVKYLDYATGKEIYPTKERKGFFGDQIVEHAQNFDSLGYERVSEEIKTLSISANTAFNVIEFYYQEKTVSLKYQVVGPDGCGRLSMYSDNISSISGKPNGSFPILSSGFIFAGWFTDAQCTTPVEASWVNGDNKLVPQKTGQAWSDATYYAKFEALETDLTITTKSTDPIDANQVFIFNIKGKEGTDTEGVDLTVTVVGNGSVTIEKLKTGEYTVTELTDWSWRYENDEAQREITLEYTGGTNEIIFDNSRENGKWLDGNAVKDNRFN